MMKMVLYKKLAKYYDKFYSSKNYPTEIDFITKLFSSYKIKVKNILDVACGTGSHAKLLTLKNYNVTGVDLNKEMLRIARKKVKRHAIFIKGDMRSLSSVVSKQYDAVILLFNSMGYNTNKRDFRRTLKEVYNHLRKGGVFIFDLNTKDLIMSFMLNPSSKSEFNFFFKDKKSFGFKHVKTKIKSNIIENSFDYLINDNSKIISVREDFHKLGLFTENEIKSMMRSEGFKVVAFHNWKFKSPSKKSYPNIFVGFKT